jgi:drug/metabolite transporter (DMT)-like permease
MRKSHLINLIFLVLVNVMWAAQYPAYKIASDHMGVASLNFWTLVFSLLLLFPFLILQKKRGPRVSSHGMGRKSFIWKFILMGLLGIVPPSVLMAWGIERSTASNGAIISMTIPVLMTLMGIIMLGERITQLRAISLVLALAGTVMISRADIARGSFDAAMLVGNIGIFFAGMGAAFFNTYGKKLLANFSELEVLIYSYLSGGAACAVLSLVMDQKPFYHISSYPLRSWLAVLVLGLASWGIAMVMWMWVLGRLEVSQVSVSVYLLPVFGVILSAVTLQEKLTVAQAVGGALVFLATFLTSEWETRRAKAGVLRDQNLASVNLEK